MNKFRFAYSILDKQIDRDDCFKLRASIQFITYHAGDIVCTLSQEETRYLIDDLNYTKDDLFLYCMENNVDGVADKQIAELYHYDSRYSEEKLNKAQSDYFFNVDDAVRDGRDLAATFREDIVSDFEWMVTVMRIRLGDEDGEFLYEDGEFYGKKLF